MSHQQQKQTLREASLARRDAIATDARIEMSLQAAEQARDNINIDPGTIVSGFFPIRSEIDPRPLMDRFRKQGARLCLPVVMDKTTIVFRELLPDGELVDTGFGTRGPSEAAAVLNPQVLLMPMSVFDLKGGRIGYGAGHYDRAIERIINKGITPRLIGMAFDCQRIDEVPVEPHDQPLEAVVSESGYYPVPS